MNIGLMSDSHSNYETIMRALDYFSNNKISTIFHAGDLDSSGMISCFKGFKFYLAAGNCDDISDFLPVMQSFGMQDIAYQQNLVIDNKKYMICHGNDRKIINEAILHKSFDFIIRGHSHTIENYTSNGVRVINPGALYRSPRYTIGIFNTENEDLQIVEIEKSIY